MEQTYFRQVPDFDYVNRTPGNKDISNYIAVKIYLKEEKFVLIYLAM